MTQNHESFPFERLEVYRVIREYIALVDPICTSLPTGEAESRSQFKRASLSVLNNLCEGAGRWGDGEKRKFYSIARGSAYECAGLLIWLEARGLGSQADIGSALQLLRRIAAMLTAMVRRYRAAG